MSVANWRYPCSKATCRWSGQSGTQSLSGSYFGSKLEDVTAETEDYPWHIYNLIHQIPKFATLRGFKEFEVFPTVIGCISFRCLCCGEIFRAGGNSAVDIGKLLSHCTARRSTADLIKNWGQSCFKWKAGLEAFRPCLEHFCDSVNVGSRCSLSLLFGQCGLHAGFPGCVYPVTHHCRALKWS